MPLDFYKTFVSHAQSQSIECGVVEISGGNGVRNLKTAQFKNMFPKL